MTVNGEQYRSMIENFIVPELVDTPGQDGATAHLANQTMELLRTFFEERIISRNTEISWPPCLPDLIAPYFFL